MNKRIRFCLLAALIMAVPTRGQETDVDSTETTAGGNPSAGEQLRPADRILEALEDGALRAMVSEVLERNPGVARARAQARAADLRAPQVRTLPDPVAGLTAWLESPETRTGPQVATFSLFQTLPCRC